MNAKDPIFQTIRGSDWFVDKYLEGFDDADLRVRPVEGMNSIAWQLGHLISVERMIVEAIKPGSCPSLPEGFDKAHGKGKGQSDDGEFATLDEYRSLWKAQRDATYATLEAQTDEELDRPNPIERLLHRATNVGLLFNFIGLHTMLHVGQFVAVRRSLGKPVAL